MTYKVLSNKYPLVLYRAQSKRIWKCLTQAVEAWLVLILSKSPRPYNYNGNQTNFFCLWPLCVNLGAQQWTASIYLCRLSTLWLGSEEEMSRRSPVGNACPGCSLLSARDCTGCGWQKGGRVRGQYCRVGAFPYTRVDPRDPVTSLNAAGSTHRTIVSPPSFPNHDSSPMWLQC